MRCRTKAAFFPLIQQKPPELGLLTRLRVELGEFDGMRADSKVESLVGKDALAHINLFPYLIICRYMRGSTFGRMRAKEIERKLAQVMGIKGPGDCTCCRESTSNTRCEVNLIDVDTFEVDLWTMFLPSLRQGMHEADDVRSLFQEEHRARVSVDRWM
jgi:hypothetical protein